VFDADVAECVGLAVGPEAALEALVGLDVELGDADRQALVGLGAVEELQGVLLLLELVDLVDVVQQRLALDSLAVVAGCKFENGKFENGKCSKVVERL